MKASSVFLVLVCFAAVPSGLHAICPTCPPTNGPGNGTLVLPLPIGSGNWTSNNFVLGTGSPIYGLDMWLWDAHGSRPLTLDWMISSEHDGGTVFASGTDVPIQTTYLFTNQRGFDIYQSFVSTPGVPNLAPMNYWLTLTNATSTNQGDQVFWDENDGMGCNFQDCPADAWSNGQDYGQKSDTFTIETTPEPNTLILIGSGIMGFAVHWRRKRM